MTLAMRRVVLFTRNLDKMATFYRDVLRLPPRRGGSELIEFDAGGCFIALHSGSSAVGKRAPKLVFYSKNVEATRDELVARGAKLGRVMSGPGLTRCEGKDPDGNPFQISNRA